jgi:hypothetical protein
MRTLWRVHRSPGSPAPQGRPESSPGRSPGFGQPLASSPVGTAETGGMISAVPTGLDHVGLTYPGLRPGLLSGRPSGAVRRSCRNSSRPKHFCISAVTRKSNLDKSEVRSPLRGGTWGKGGLLHRGFRGLGPVGRGAVSFSAVVPATLGRASPKRRSAPHGNRRCCGFFHSIAWLGPDRGQAALWHNR